MSRKIEWKDLEVMSPKVRVSYPHVFKPNEFNGKKKYSMQMLIPKSIDPATGKPFALPSKDPVLAKMMVAATNAKIKEWGDDPKEWPKGMVSPFKNGDAPANGKDRPEQKGMWVVRASTGEEYPPQVIALDGKTLLTNEREFYAGCYARAMLKAGGYEYMGKNGVTFYLDNIQKLGDGKKFSGKKDASEQFDAVEDQSEDAGGYEEPTEAEESENDSGEADW